MTVGQRRYGEWQRLHPITIVKELGAVAWAFVGAVVLDIPIPGLPADVENTEAVLAIAVFGVAVARYLFTGYRLTDKTVEMRRGVFVKRHRSMPRDRVQSVGVNTGFIGRFIGVSSVEVSAADTEEISLSYVSRPEAEVLRRLLEPGGGVREGEREGPVPPPESSRIAEMAPGDLVLFAATDTGLLVAGLAAVALVFVTVIARVFVAPLGLVAVFWWPVVRAMGLVGFRSWIEGDRIRIERGLLSRRQTDAPLARIQTIQVARPPLRRAAGFETVSLATGDVSGSLDDALSDGLVAPLVATGGWRRVAREILGEVALGETDLRRPSRLAVRRAAVRGMVASLVVSGLVAAIAVLLEVTAWTAGVVLAFGVATSWLYARARWRRLGWAADTRHLLVRRGVVRHTLAVVPLAKIQDVTVRATYFQRRLGLATVVVDTAGVAVAGHVRAIDLEAADADWLARRLASTAAAIALPDGV